MRIVIDLPSRDTDTKNSLHTACMVFCLSEIGWKTILMKDAYEALYCGPAAMSDRLVPRRCVLSRGEEQMF